MQDLNQDVIGKQADSKKSKNVRKTKDSISKNRKPKPSVLDFFKTEIQELIAIGVTVPNIAKIVNQKLPDGIKMSNSSFYYWLNKQV